METDNYSELLHQMVRILVEEIADDVVGIVLWKKSRAKPTTPRIEYGDGEFPSDSGSPLSTFSTFSSPPQKSSPAKSSTNSSNTPTFAELKGEDETDMVTDDSCPITESINTNFQIYKIFNWSY